MVKARLSELERMLGRLGSEEGSDCVHIDLNVVRRDMLAIVLAMEQIGIVALGALDEREHPAALFARILMDGQRPVIHIDDGVVAVGPVLPAVEHPCAAPYLAQAAHRHAAGTDRTGISGNRAHEEYRGTGGAVRLNRHFIGNVGGGHAPVRQGFRMRVDIDQNRIIVAVPALAGQRIYAVLGRIFARHVNANLS